MSIGKRLKGLYYRGSYYSGLTSVVGRVGKTLGMILCLHRVVRPETLSTFGNRSIELTDEALSALIRDFRGRGYDFISINDVEQALIGGKPRSQPWVCITFDDGYHDNFSLAWPILRAEKVPFAVYVTASFLDRTVRLWWYAIAHALARRSALSVDLPGLLKQEFELDTDKDRDRAFKILRTAYMSARAEDQELLLRIVIGDHFQQELDVLASELTMSWDDLRRMSNDPFVTIGAHTLTHPALSRLSVDAARNEMEESRRRLENVLGKPVRHFAYPFGSPSEAGEREVKLAAELNFATAVTTRIGGIVIDHAKVLHALPRVPVQGHMDALLQARVHGSGLTTMLAQRRLTKYVDL